MFCFFQKSRIYERIPFKKSEILKKRSPSPSLRFRPRHSLKMVPEFGGELLKLLELLEIPDMAPKPSGLQLKAKGLGNDFIGLGCTPSGSYVLFFSRILEFTKGFLF